MLVKARSHFRVVALARLLSSSHSHFANPFLSHCLSALLHMFSQIFSLSPSYDDTIISLVGHSLCSSSSHSVYGCLTHPHKFYYFIFLTLPFFTVTRLQLTNANPPIQPLSAKQVNEELGTHPGLVNESAQDKGWLIKFHATDKEQVDALMSEEEYNAFLKESSNN